MKPRLVTALLVAAAAAVWIAWSVRREDKARVPPDAAGVLRVVFLNVGYGDAAWVSTPGGKHFLVDGGPGTFGKVREGGLQLLFSPANVKLSVENYLRERGVKRLEAVFIANSRYDHWGGLDAVISGLEVGAVYESTAAEADAAYEKFREKLQARGLRPRALSAGRRVDVGDPAVSVDVLGPRRSYRGSDHPESNASLVLKVAFGEVSALFTGDASPESEFDMMESGEALTADLLKVSSHGSQYATSAPFLDWVRPGAAVVSVESPNPFGHPQDETLQKFVDRDIPYYRTDLDGHVLFVTDGKAWSVYPRWER
jgi:competence protein ComEC